MSVASLRVRTPLGFDGRVLPQSLCINTIRMFVCLYVCLFVCLFFCIFVCLYVCLSAGYTCLIEPYSIHVLSMGRSGFIIRGSYRKINSVPPTLLPLRAKTYPTLISFYNIFRLFFSQLTSPVIKSLTRYILLYICNL